MTIAIAAHDAMLIVDMQKDFLPGGSLTVAKGDELIPILNRYLALARLHPPESLQTMRERAAGQLASLPERLRTLEAARSPYYVAISPVLRKLADQVDRMTGDIPALCR